MHKFYTGVYLIIISAFGFGIMPILAIYAYRSHININTLLFLRFFIAALCFFGYLWLTGKKISASRREILALFLMGGVFYTLQSSLYFTSLKYISPSLTALLLYTYPMIVPLLSFIFAKERLTAKHLVASSLTFAGLVLVLGGPAGKISMLGVAMAFGAAVVYSCYIVLGNRLIQQIPSVTASAFIALFAACSFGAVSLFTQSLQLNFGLSGWAPLLGIMLFSTVIAMLTFFKGMEKTGPTTASIISTLEPLVTILGSILLFREKLSAFQLLGAAAVLSGAVIVVLAKRGPDVSLKAREFSE